MYFVSEISKNTWEIKDEWIRCFLIVGDKKALLVDTLVGDKDLKGEVKKLTSLPVETLNTHNHFDHVGANKDFDITYVHENEALEAEKYSNKVIPVKEGTIIDLGGREVEVVELFGHSKGSIGVLDRKEKFIIVGDAVTTTTNWMNFPDSDFNACIKSMDKLIEMKEKGTVEKLFSCHGICEADISYAREIKELAGIILSGNFTREDYKLNENTNVDIVRHGRVSMYIVKN